MAKTDKDKPDKTPTPAPVPAPIPAIPYAKLDLLQVGSWLISDGTVSCMPLGRRMVVEADPNNPSQRRVMCTKGSHRLNYQTLTGLYMIPDVG